MKSFLKIYSILILNLWLLTGCGSALEEGENGPDSVPDGSLRIFVTSQSYTGNLGGIIGANSLCATAATNAGLVKTYKALLSAPGNFAKNRLTTDASIYTVSSTGPRRVADSLNALFNTNIIDLKAEIRYDEFTAFTTNTAWTGTDAYGEVGTTGNCSSWTSSSGADLGTVGDSTATSASWTEFQQDNCNQSHSLYCISQ
jgi:hypothetical protein